MFAVALITHSDSDQTRSPITHESFCSSVEDGFAANRLCSGAIDEHVIEEDGAVGSGQF